MKVQKSFFFGVLLTVCYMHSSAQQTLQANNEPDYNKPKIFADLPEKMKFQFTDMERLIHLSVGTAVNTFAATNFPLIGTVVSVSDPIDPSVKSVIVKLENRGGATLTFTRIINEQGQFEYKGRIINKNSIDAIDIVRENGNYILVKKNLYDLFSE
jgi:hypothetical protein